MSQHQGSPNRHITAVYSGTVGGTVAGIVGYRTMPGAGIISSRSGIQREFINQSNQFMRSVKLFLSFAIHWVLHEYYWVF